MIMWRSRITLASFIVLSCVIGPSVGCGPDLSDLDLSGCMKDCNAVAKQCLDVTEKRLDACAPEDDQCRLDAVHDSEVCLTTCLDCISTCVEETERTLNGG